jgi:hypothetical protein
MKIFLSHSFEDRDKEVVKWFSDFLPTAVEGIEIMSTKNPELKEIWPKIQKDIRESIAVVCLFTKDMKVERKNLWKPKDWVVSEAIYSFSIGRPTFIFLEKGVRMRGIPELKEYVPFRRGDNELEKIRGDAIKYLRSILTPFIGQDYCVECCENRNYIHKDRHGLVESIVTLRATSDEFSKIKYGFALVGPPYNAKFPKWHDLKKSKYKDRFSKATFFAEVLDDFGIRRKIQIGEPEISNNGRKIDISMNFTPRLKAGERVQYIWGWSHPRMYRRAGTISYQVTHPTQEFIFKLFFEKGSAFTKKPSVCMQDQNDNKLGKKVKLASHCEPGYDVFTRVFSPVSQNATYKGRWKLKKVQ